MILFLSLIIVHLIGDFYLQKQTWIACKIENKFRSMGLFKHILVHLALTSLIIFTVSTNPIYEQIAAIVIVVVTHYAIDIWKTYQRFSLFSFLLDQFAHLFVIIGVCAWLSDIDWLMVSVFFKQNFSIKWLIIISFYLFALKPVSLLLYLILRRYTEQLEAESSTSQGLENAGEHIGYIERGLIVSFILLNQFAAVGFLLAAKGVFRFGDMRRESDRKLTEYIMLGTLFSFSFAIAVGQLAKYCLLLVS